MLSQNSFKLNVSPFYFLCISVVRTIKKNSWYIPVFVLGTGNSLVCSPSQEGGIIGQHLLQEILKRNLHISALVPATLPCGAWLAMH